MAIMVMDSSLSIILPTLNEAKRLPLLFADINSWSTKFELLIIDAGSSDDSIFVAELAGAKVYKFPEPNRGAQMRSGASKASGDWLLFLHADSRLPKNWDKSIKAIIAKPSASNSAWYFDFKVNHQRIELRLLEIAVFLRSSLLKRPYGDQGLLIKKVLYERLGGFKPLHLMEDLEFIERINTRTSLKRIGIPLFTNSRKWENEGVLKQAFRNAKLRRRWRKGDPTNLLLKDYYSKKIH